MTLRLGVQTDAFFKKLKGVIGSYRFAEKLEDGCFLLKGVQEFWSSGVQTDA